MAVEHISKGNDDGTTFGQSASDLISFHNATPIAQMAVTTAPAATAATSTTPFGFSQTQADAIVTWIRAVDAHFKLKGLIASS